MPSISTGVFSEQDLRLLFDALSYMYRARWAQVADDGGPSVAKSSWDECVEINRLQHRLVELIQPKQPPRGSPPDQRFQASLSRAILATSRSRS